MTKRDKKNKRKGQVTLFIILGIVIVVLVALFFAARKTVWMPVTEENLKTEMEEIEEHILDCIGDIGEDYIVKIGEQGGYLSTPEETYKYWNDTTISYLCWNQVDKPSCTNRLLTLEDMKTQLDESIKFGLQTCIEVFEFGRLKPYEIIAETNYEVDVDIKPRKVFVTLDYPITLKSKKTDLKVSQKEFTKDLDYPLGQLYDISQDILDFETEFGEFDQLMYMLSKRGKFMIYKWRPYPDKIYILKRTDNPYKFQFAIEGEPL